jgi:hypothetical protein
MFNDNIFYLRFIRKNADFDFLYDSFTVPWVAYIVAETLLNVRVRMLLKDPLLENACFIFLLLFFGKNLQTDK